MNKNIKIFKYKRGLKLTVIIVVKTKDCITDATKIPDGEDFLYVTKTYVNAICFSKKQKWVLIQREENGPGMRWDLNNDSICLNLYILNKKGNYNTIIKQIPHNDSLEKELQEYIKDYKLKQQIEEMFKQIK